jgi:hypothetical protein
MKNKKTYSKRTKNDSSIFDKVERLKAEGIKEGEETWFQIHAKNLFLTYPRVPSSWDKKYVLKELENKLIEPYTYVKNGKEYGVQGASKIRHYIISEEQHEDGGKHYHCVIELKKTIRITNSSFLDIGEQHGNYQPVYDKKSVVNYVKKGGNYIEDQNGLILLDDKNRKLLEAKTEADVKMMIMDKMPSKEIVQFWKENNVSKMNIIEREVVKEKIIEFEFFKIFEPFHKGPGVINHEEIEISNSRGKVINTENKRRPVGVFLYGPPETGKSSLARYMSAKTGYSICSIRDFKQFNSVYNGEQIILFDEMTEKIFEKMQENLSSLITDENYATPSHYRSVKIKWPRKVILATNEDISLWQMNANVKARLLIIKLDEDYSYRTYMYLNSRIMEEVNVGTEKSIERDKSGLEIGLGKV